MDADRKTLIRLLRRPLSLGRYCWQYGAWNLIIWFLVFLASSRLVYSWMQRDDLISLEYTFFLTVWMAFFAGFVGYCTSTLYPRMKLLTGRLEPTPAEWGKLDACESRTLAGGFWKPALGYALILALTSSIVFGVVLLISGEIDQISGFTRQNYGVYTVILPSVYVAFLASRVARVAVVRLIVATERHAPVVIPRRRYVFLHNVLPYALFSSTAGIFSAFARFADYYQSAELVPVDELSVHLAMTALVIAFFVVGAARVKTRVDFLSPIVLAGPKPEKIRASWRLLYAFWVPLVVYFGLRGIFWIFEIRGVETWVAILLKVGICLTIAITMAYWAVTSILSKLEDEGLEAHSIVRIYRFLVEAGYFKETEKA